MAMRHRDNSNYYRACYFVNLRSRERRICRDRSEIRLRDASSGIGYIVVELVCRSRYPVEGRARELGNDGIYPDERSLSYASLVPRGK